jgi:two-component system chemotaxis sensor kinase CheA
MAVADPYKYFRVEAGEILEQLQQGLLDLEKGAPAPEIVPKLLRLAHTLKGAARVVKQAGIADLSHAVEDLLVPLREAATVVAASTIQTSLQHVDAMRVQLSALSTPHADTPAASQGAALGAAAGAAGAPEAAFWAARRNVQDLDVLMDGIGELNVRIGGVRGLRRALERAKGLAELMGDHLLVRHGAQSNEAELGKMRSLSDELQSVLALTERELSTSFEQATRELGQVRDAAERLRLVPVDLLWSSLERTARDAALSLGKNVSFQAHGGDLRLEAELLAQVQRALLQAVRNAVAHGIETPSERAALGKPPAGMISIAVFRRDDQVVFSCTDDGRGLDLEAIRRSAEQRGLKPAELAGMNADGLAQLLLRGGISTSRAVTAVSGRGIGLDLIRETADNLGGTVTLRGAAPHGVVISMAVPVSLSALSALLAEVAGQVVALPLHAVRGTARQQPEDIAHSAEGESVLVEGKVVPYTELSRLLHTQAPETERVSRASVWVQAQEGSVALGVERLLGIESIVVRALPELSLLSAIVSGASFDAEGNPRLVLSPEGLVNAARSVAAAPRVAPKRHAPILVIDDSLTTRMLEQAILESAGYEVDVAVSGEEGMDKARQRKYGLFLVDVEMPGMDGFSFIERTRSDPDLRDTPAILVTSRASPEDVQRGREVGALAHIEKREFNQTDLLARIRKLVT